MGSDFALYVAVEGLDGLRRSLPHGFIELDLLEECAFARAFDPDRSPGEHVAVAAELSAAGHDTMVVAYDGWDEFFFAHCRAGLSRRLLALRERRWIAVDGTPEPWERELPTAPAVGEAIHDNLDPWSLCDLVGEVYRLTGWHRSLPPRRDAELEVAIRTAALDLLDRKRAAAERATTLHEALDGAVVGWCAVPRALFEAHAAFYVLTDDRGVPLFLDATGDRPRDMMLFTSEDALREWRGVFGDAPTHGPIDGRAVLDLAARHRAQRFDINNLGPGPIVHLSTRTLDRA